MKQTAMQELKWFICDGSDNFDESVKVSEIWTKINELLEMEKQQIIEADLNASVRTAKALDCRITPLRIKELAEQYYNETFNK